MSDYIYSGFWRRFGAYLLDSSMLIMIERYIDKLNLEEYLIIMLSLILRVLYWSLFESSQA